MGPRTGLDAVAKRKIPSIPIPEVALSFSCRRREVKMILNCVL